MKRSTKRIIGAIFGTLIILMFVRTLFINWTHIQNFQFDLNIPLFILSTSILILIVYLWSVLWNLLLHDLNCRKLSFNDSFKIQVQAWFGRYLPGKLGIVGIKFFLGKQKGIDDATNGISVVYENVFQIASAFLVSVPILLFYSFKQLGENTFLYLVVPISLVVGLYILIHPRVFFLIVNTGLRLFKKQVISKDYFLRTGQILKYLIFYSLVVVLNGVAFFIFVQSVTTLSLDCLIPLIGIFNFAGIIGMLAIFTPAGLGIREGVIVFFLQAYFPLEIGIFISVISRLWATIADFIIGVYIFTIKKNIKMEEMDEGKSDRFNNC